MTRQEAIELIKEVVEIEVKGTKQECYRRGGMTKKLQKEEFRAIRKLFEALTASLPADEEVKEILGYGP